MFICKGVPSSTIAEMAVPSEYNLRVDDVKACANVQEFNTLLTRVFGNKLQNNQILNSDTIAAKDADGFSFRYGHHGGSTSGGDAQGPILFTIANIRVPKTMEFILSAPRQVSGWWGGFHVISETALGKIHVLRWRDTVEDTTTAGKMWINDNATVLFSAATFTKKQIVLDVSNLTRCFQSTDEIINLHFCAPKTIYRTDIRANANIWPLVINGIRLSY